MTTQQEPSEGHASFGLWQIIDMTVDARQTEGTVDMHRVRRPDFFHPLQRRSAEDAVTRWRALREQAAAALTGGRFEVHLPPYEQRARDDDRVPARDFLERLQVRDICHDPLVLDIETQCQMPPPSAFDQVTIPAGNWMSYDALREMIGGAATDLREQDTRSRLLQRVEAARREVAIMNIALDNGADPCECGSWEVTYATALDRWVCSQCADSEAEDLHEEDDARTGEMRGVSTHLAVYDELARYVRNDAAETARMLAEAVAGPVELPQPRNLSREQFVASYWRMGLDIVNPQDAIRITGV